MDRFIVAYDDAARDLIAEHYLSYDEIPSYVTVWLKMTEPIKAYLFPSGCVLLYYVGTGYHIYYAQGECGNLHLAEIARRENFFCQKIEM